MYRKSVDHKQLDAFSSPIEYLKDSTMNYYLKMTPGITSFANRL